MMGRNNRLELQRNESDLLTSWNVLLQLVVLQEICKYCKIAQDIL